MTRQDAVDALVRDYGLTVTRANNVLAIAYALGLKAQPVAKGYVVVKANGGTPPDFSLEPRT